MRTSTMPSLQTGMPETLAQVRVPYVNYNQSTILYSDDYMFLPAEKEVFGTYSYSMAIEANALTQFAYYKNGGSKTGGNYWWLRSASNAGPNSFCEVAHGKASKTGASGQNSTIPCFCV